MNNTSLEEKLKEITNRLNECCCTNVVYNDEVEVLIAALRILLKSNEIAGRMISGKAYELLEVQRVARQARSEVEALLLGGKE